MNNPLQIIDRDGSVTYTTALFPDAAAQDIFRKLSDEIDWQPDEVKLFGKTIITARKTAWYGDKSYEYRYSGTVKKALPFPQELQSIRDRLLQETGYYFNSCLANLYHNGSESMSWHSDNEPVMDPGFPIASLSFGAQRRFRFRHLGDKTTETVLLEPGSLLMMYPPLQQHWQHCLPRMAAVREARINLTFRRFTEHR
ncbi:alpha-ketoglutarate-dependent dioxygenase AlkB [Rurimicrobium arvi]|uniref:Alpha-ketoglutarate-dependent dioxygenase AlkB n=1 Tax=Rurimicrobium arvi TaxID=2049916 RepID=A0ABP8MWW4_9BACT